MNAEKTLKKMLAPGGALDVLKHDLLAIELLEQSYGSFESLFQLLSVVAKFQYGYHRKMDEIKRFYAKNEDVFVLLGPIHNMIKRAGMDIYKSEKHHSFIKNHCSLKKKKISFKSFSITTRQIFVYTDFLSVPQRLSLVMDMSKQQQDFLHQQMLEGLDYDAKNFFLETKNRITTFVCKLQKQFD